MKFDELTEAAVFMLLNTLCEDLSMDDTFGRIKAIAKKLEDFGDVTITVDPDRSKRD